jgi:hypothetical protein
MLTPKSVNNEYAFFPSGKHRRSIRVSSRHDERRALADDPGDDRGRLEEQEARHARRRRQALLKTGLSRHKGLQKNPPYFKVVLI